LGLRSCFRPSIVASINPPFPAIGGGGSPALDADALDYFSRAEALGGSFNQTGLNALYTEAYVKTAISNFVAGCKTDSIWTKLIEVYLLTGVTFGGLMAKLKHAGTATLTNNNFVSGDYLAVGSGAGLTDGASKRLTTGLTLPASHSMGLYLQTNDATSNGRLMGSYGAAEGGARFQTNAAGINFFGGLAASGSVSTTGPGLGMLIGNAANGAQSLYSNGSLVGTNTQARAAVTTTFNLLSVNGITGDTTCRQSFAFYGSVLDATEAASLSTRVNALMTALGANVY
jgi:hypothetical protein